MTTNPSKTSLLQQIFRILLGLNMLFAGVGHMTFLRAEFQAQVPDWTPFSKDFIVLASGVVEILLGLAMVIGTKYRVYTGLALALFFVLVFPGNIAQYINGIDAFGLDTDTKRLVRLFFQPVLIAWAMWSSGAYQYWIKHKNYRNLG
ncbi:DoxX family protein [Echinicola vietnamensis]|uniref:Putative membrane protein n=1 Tax=Echinicola vietnamensis (strain DSM 17526 / LMG 23754 / KMM 6221) TaxID=926556 RepID=L0G074_ECHVK|nr:DoxX family membrane protein [Echinicola vietnamensis]AGA79564.1 putative membrane protein [Echinicola vietnamensis DSM 17526]